MSNTTSPFELRMNMLAMAKDYLDRQNDIMREAAYQAWQANVEFAKKAGQAIPAFPADYTKVYGVEEITKMAETFNRFVSGGK